MLLAHALLELAPGTAVPREHGVYPLMPFRTLMFIGFAYLGQ